MIRKGVIRFADSLKEEIGKGLPGKEVQWALASSDRMVKAFPKVPRKDSAKAAVLILLYPVDGIVHTVFIQRPEYNGVHGGQISFPGGKKELSDQDLLQTAVREASEETGIDPSAVKIIGTLTPLYIPVSNIVVTPYVGWSDKKPLFTPEAAEVVFLIEADIGPFLDYSIIKIKPFEIRGERINIKYFDYKGNVIWGATAMILNELLTIISRGKISPRV
jgi:8-oxo-dGTP pyrophosphatase MutT (NUDIX family)